MYTQFNLQPLINSVTEDVKEATHPGPILDGLLSAM